MFNVMRSVYISCPKCEYKVVEKYIGCEHEKEKAGIGGVRSAAPMATVFIGPNGEVSVPGQRTDRMPKRLEKLGYRVQTIQNSADYSKFCKNMDSVARARYERVNEARQAYFEAKAKEERAELRRVMQTQFGKDYLEAAIAASEGGYERRFDAGSHIEGFEFDSKHGRD